MQVAKFHPLRTVLFSPNFQKTTCKKSDCHIYGWFSEKGYLVSSLRTTHLQNFVVNLKNPKKYLSTCISELISKKALVIYVRWNNFNVFKVNILFLIPDLFPFGCGMTRSLWHFGVILQLSQKKKDSDIGSEQILF